MRRVLSALLVLALLAATASSVVAHERVRSGAAGDICPMMSHQPSAKPCIGEPCPCDHGSDSSVLPDGVKLAAPEPASVLTAPLTAWNAVNILDSTSADGFPSHIDHPPALRN